MDSVVGSNGDAVRPFHEAKQDVIERFEREYAQMVLRRHSGNISAAARAAGIDRKSLVRLLARHGLAVADLLGAEEYGE